MRARIALKITFSASSKPTLSKVAEDNKRQNSLPHKHSLSFEVCLSKDMRGGGANVDFGSMSKIYI